MSTLNENINRVSVVLEDIKEAIQEKGGTVGDCTSPEEYGDAIRALSSTGGSGGSCTCDLSPYAKTTYVDAQIATVKKHADDLFNNGNSSMVTKTYVDTQDLSVLESAQNYAITQATAKATKAYNDACEYADSILGANPDNAATVDYVNSRDTYVLNKAEELATQAYNDAVTYHNTHSSGEIDEVLGDTTNPVQNKAIYNALKGKQDLLTGDSTLFSLREGSKEKIDVKYGSTISIDGNGNTTVIAGNVYIELINDTKFIGVGSNGIFEGTKFKLFTTDVNLKYGGDNIAIETLEVGTIGATGITYEKAADNSYIDWYIDNNTNLNNPLSIKVTASGYYDGVLKTAYDTVQIVGVKSAEDGVSYDLDFNYAYILGRRQSDGSYKYTPNNTEGTKLTARVYYTHGNQRELVGGDDYIIKYYYDNDTPARLTGGYDVSATKYLIPVPTPTDEKFFNVELYKKVGSAEVLWDHETFGIVKDGANGADAVDVEQLIIVDDHKYVATGDDYIYDGNDITHTSEAYVVYNGERIDSNIAPVQITNTGDKIIGTVGQYKSDTKSWPITWTIKNGVNLQASINAKVTATCKIDNITKTVSNIVTFIGTKGAADGVIYDLDVNCDFIIADPGNTTSNNPVYTFSPDKVNALLYRTKNGKRALVTDRDWRITCKADNYLQAYAANIGTSAINNITIPTGVLTVPGVVRLEVEVKNPDTNTYYLMCTEYLEVVRNGFNGAKGEDGVGLKEGIVFAAEYDNAGSTEVYPSERNTLPGTQQYPIGSTYTPVAGDLALITKNTGDLSYIEEVAVYKYNGTTWKIYPGTSTLTVGTFAISPYTGHIIVWTGSIWNDVGTIRGNYIHQKFANEVLTGGTQISYLNKQLKFTDPLTTGGLVGETPGAYIGILVDNTSTDSDIITDYKWTAWGGEDGYGLEQIFMLGPSDKIPPKPTLGDSTTAANCEASNAWYTFDYEPRYLASIDSYYKGKQWSDNPKTPTETENVCWMSWRMLSVTGKREWSTPREYLYYLQNGQTPTVVVVQNGNITTLVDETGKTVAANKESCKFDVYVDNVLQTSNVNIGVLSVPTGITVSQETGKNDGSFIVEIPKGIDLSLIDKIQVDCKFGTPVTTYSEYVTLSKLKADRNYNIKATPQVVLEDAYTKGTYTNLGAGNTINFEVTIDRQSGVQGEAVIFNGSTANPDYKVYATYGTTTTAVTGTSTTIPFIGGNGKTLTSIEVRSHEGTGYNDVDYYYNDHVEFTIYPIAADGMDAAQQEFVYITQLTSKTTPPSLQYIEGSDDPYSSVNEASYTYNTSIKYQDNDWCPYCNDAGNKKRWEDNPTGVSEGYTEWCAVRKKEAGIAGASKWGAFEAPFIWSSYGKSGKDGDGIEYIFAVNDSATTAPGINQGLGKINGQTNYNANPANSSEWLPLKDITKTGTWYSSTASDYWSDNPQDVTSQQPYQWVSKRKYDGTSGKWGLFCAPTRWSVYAEANTKADFRNDSVSIGVGNDGILDLTTVNVSIKNDITLTNGSTKCTNLQIQNVYIENTAVAVTGTNTYKVEGENIILTLDTATVNQSSCTALEFAIQLKNGLDLNNPRFISFDIAGKIGVKDYYGRATFSIVGLKGAADGVWYDIALTPTGITVINVDGTIKYSSETIVPTINKIISGKTTESYNWSAGELKYYYDGNSAATQNCDAAGVNIKAYDNANPTALPNTITFVFEKDGFTDVETAYIYREKKSIKEMFESYAIYPKGSTVTIDNIKNDINSTTNSKWANSINNAIIFYNNVNIANRIDNLTGLGDTLELWNAIIIVYTDDTVDVVDIQNLGSGIKQVVEYYKTNNPDKIVDTTTDTPTLPATTLTLSNFISTVENTTYGWSTVNAGVKNKYDALWNFELIILTDGTYKVTTPALLSQLVHGESPYSLRIENQYPQISCDSYGNISENANIFSSKAIMYCGDTALTDVTYEIAPWSITIRGGNKTSGTIGTGYCVGKRVIDNVEYYLYQTSGDSNESRFYVPENQLYTIGVGTEISSNVYWSVSGAISNTKGWVQSFKKLSINNDGVITSDADYKPVRGISDCYSYVKATKGGVSVTDCLATHAVLKGSHGLPYVFRGEWYSDIDADNKSYYNNDQRIDIVKVTTDSTAKYYMCGTTHEAYNKTWNATSSNWIEFVGEYKNIATEFLFAEELKAEVLDVATAYADSLMVDNLSANELHVLNDAGEEVITASDTDINILANSTNAVYLTNVNGETTWGAQGTDTITLNLGTIKDIRTSSSDTISTKLPTISVNVMTTYHVKGENKSIKATLKIGGQVPVIANAVQTATANANAVTRNVFTWFNTGANNTSLTGDITVTLEIGHPGNNAIGQKAKANWSTTISGPAVTTVSSSIATKKGVFIGNNGMLVKGAQEQLAFSITNDGKIETAGLVRSSASGGVKEIKIVTSENDVGDETGVLYILLGS